MPREMPNMREISGYDGWITLEPLSNGKVRMMLDGKAFRDVEINCFSPESRIEDCDRDGVDIQVLSTIPVLFNYWAKPEHCLYLSQFLNDHVSDICKKYPNRFWGLGTIPMQAPDLAVKEIHRSMTELNLKGIQIGSHVNQWNLDAPEFYPIWEACEQLDFPIFVHPWDMDNKGRMADYWFPWLVGMPCETTMAIASLMMGGVLERFPRLRISFAHGCGSFPYTASRIQHGYEVRPDLCAQKCQVAPSKFMNRIWSDSLVHDEETLKFLMKKVNVNQIMLGSDYPFPLGEHHPGLMIEQSKSLTDDEKQRILSLNAMQFFNANKCLNGTTNSY